MAILIGAEHFKPREKEVNIPAAPSAEAVSPIDTIVSLAEKTEKYSSMKLDRDRELAKSAIEDAGLKYGKDSKSILSYKRPESWWKGLSQPHWRSIELDREILGTEMTKADMKDLYGEDFNPLQPGTTKLKKQLWDEPNIASKMYKEGRSEVEIAHITGLKTSRDASDRLLLDTYNNPMWSTTEKPKTFLEKRKDVRKARRDKIKDRFSSEGGEIDAYQSAFAEGLNKDVINVSDNLADTAISNVPTTEKSIPGSEMTDSAFGSGVMSQIGKSFKRAKKAGTLGQGGVLSNIGFDPQGKNLFGPKGIGKGGMKNLFKNLGKGNPFQAASTNPAAMFAGMTPLGWAMMGMSVLGMGGIFKPHTFLGKIFSDEKLKEDITYVGKSPSGIPIHEFKYKGIQARFRGVLSKSVPWASSVHPTGYKVVDYNKVDVPFERVG